MALLAAVESSWEGRCSHSSPSDPRASSAFTHGWAHSGIVDGVVVSLCYHRSFSSSWVSGTPGDPRAQLPLTLPHAQLHTGSMSLFPFQL